MARIRTIKPEFPQSESMGRVSRDARLLFIQLWTQADDEGRLRGASRMLASLLFPYDDDAAGRIDDWIDELDRQGCLRLYRKDGHTYIEVANWLEHQKIDKPSRSKFPAFDEGSRIFAKPREPSSWDQGPRIKEWTKDQGSEEGTSVADATPPVALALVAKPPRPSDEANQAVAEWNDMAQRVGLATVQRLNPNRRNLLTARLAECGGIEGWRSAMAKVEASAFLRGQVRSNGHEGWRATFDFMLKQASFTKLMEGNYDDRKAGTSAATNREILEAVGLDGRVESH